MALTYTPSPELEKPLPEFSLPGVDNKTYSSNDFKNAKVQVYMFICNHCPYVQAVEDRIIELGKKYSPEEVAFVAICSNDSSDHPEDSFENLQKRWKEKSYPFPYLHDESQEVARSFGAVCTPDFFVFDQNKRLAYRGRLDDSWRDASKVTKEELKEAIDALLKGDSSSDNQIPSMGCSIKWKPR